MRIQEQNFLERVSVTVSHVNKSLISRIDFLKTIEVSFISLDVFD